MHIGLPYNVATQPVLGMIYLMDSSALRKLTSPWHPCNRDRIIKVGRVGHGNSCSIEKGQRLEAGHLKTYLCCSVDQY